jgi:DNA-binding CsgD family transcriptional regulator
MTKEVAMPVSPGVSTCDVPDVVQPLLEAEQDERDLRDAIWSAVQRLGFASFGFDRFNRSPDGVGSRWSNWGTTSEGWRKRVHERNYSATTPLHRAAFRSSVPERWNHDRFAHDPALAGFFEDAASFGICSGVCMAIPSGDVRYAHFFTVSSPAKVVSNAQMKSSVAELWALGAYGHRLLPAAALGGGELPANGRGLTRRALECLSLVARGATSRVIARKLGISERTVNAHIEQAIVRLGAKNRQEAVAMGIVEGIISL